MLTFKKMSYFTTIQLLLSCKTIKCKKALCQVPRTCTFYHSATDKRRLACSKLLKEQHLIEYAYSNILCEKIKIKCSEGDRCMLAHNDYEVAYHPVNFLRGFCSDFEDGCSLGTFCPLLHGISNRY